MFEGIRKFFAKESEQSAAVAGGLYSNDTLIEQITNPKDMEAWIDLYSKDIWVNAGASSIARILASLNIQLIRLQKNPGQDNNDIQKIEDHKILDLLERPNKEETKYDLIEALSVYLDMVGTAYWEIVFDNLGLPIELYNIRPSRITPIPDKNGRGIKEYIFQVKERAKKIPFSPEEIVPFKYFNPLNDWQGLGTVQPAVDEIQLESYMVNWNKEFFKRGTIEGILRTDKPLTPKDILDVRKMWEEMRTKQGRNTPVLAKGLEYQQLGAMPVDTEFMVGRKDNRTSVLSVMGVPPIKVGLLDQAKYDNYKLQTEEFNKNTIMPRTKKIGGILTNFLLPHYPDLRPKGNVSYYLQFDTSTLLKQDEDKQVSRVKEQIRHGLLTPNEGRKLLGFALSDDPKADLLYIDNRLTPLQSMNPEEVSNGNNDKGNNTKVLEADTLNAE